ncbi:hypothetical protein GCM10027277_33510 [Pseudoduganella ginsengisoli]|uniref:RHS repeat protein n=1 Tax=Pseudoduganella ginsengisoli TaxID=1462440 RepID=A0A6L6Q6V9_9BURK|nr:DUF6531 domain-containing protein [Pseudoduganella ginsengisoli]MTW05335.1 hypothetical protein [Pseudoduganella ginsengisoli]
MKQKLICVATLFAAAHAHADMDVVIANSHYQWGGNFVTGGALYSACANLVNSVHENVTTWCGASAPNVAPDGFASIVGGWIYDKTLPSGAPKTYYYLSAYACTDSKKVRYFADVKQCVPITEVTTPTPSDPKVNGPSCPQNQQDRQPSCGNPIGIGSGTKTQQEIDYEDRSAGLPLSLIRTYNYGQNLVSGIAGSFGTYWTHPVDRKIQLLPNRVVTKCYIRSDSGAQFCESAPVSSTPQAISVTRPDGRIYYFNRSSDGWVGDADVNARVSAQYGADGITPEVWTYTSPDGDVEQYDANGRLIRLTARTGAFQRFTYSDGVTNDTNVGRMPADAPACPNVQPGAVNKAGLLLCVTDNWNRQIQFEYDAQGRVNKAYDPANQAYLYAYNGSTAGCVLNGTYNKACEAGNLTQVTYPDGKKRTYHYNEKARINGGSPCNNSVAPVSATYGYLLNALTGITDEKGDRYASWDYNCKGAVIGSEHAGAVEKVRVAYGTPAADGSRTNTVTSYLGTLANPVTLVRNYHFKIILGVAKVDTLDQPCAGCDNMMARTYDVNGNVLTAKDWNGNQTNYTYDMARNLETSRTEAVGSSVARTIKTEWHATQRLPARIAEPLRITTYTYDANGNVLTKSVQATTDTSGAQGFNATADGTPRNWTYTYNELGQVTTVTAPRNAITTYSYDSEGRLASVTNAVGHVTTLSNYDVNGRVGRITDPNGLVTDMTYTPRGWIASSTTGGESTVYEYDGVGQLIKATQPDGAWVSYTYDAAHRLTAITDRTGNSITYTLDLAGNRINEQVKDSGGALARQISRTYNTLNRLTQITGALQ